MTAPYATGQGLPPLATRAILYTDTIDGKQVSRDDMWAVTTAELRSLELPEDLKRAYELLFRENAELRRKIETLSERRCRFGDPYDCEMCGGRVAVVEDDRGV